MKVLVATSKTQGQRRSDFDFVPDGELVGPMGFEEDNEAVDGPCGCRRSLSGLDTRKATTTFEVVERPDLTEASLRQLVANSLIGAGWIPADRPQDAKTNELIDAVAGELLDILVHFEVGDVLEKRGHVIRQRRVA